MEALWPKQFESKLPEFPSLKRRCNSKWKLKGELNITSFIACQRVDQRLFLHVGNLLQSGEPDLLVSKDALFWDVPVDYAFPDCGILGRVGHVLVDAQTGDMKLKDSTPFEEMKANAQRLDQQAAPQAAD
jgi:hypothetical protein